MGSARDAGNAPLDYRHWALNRGVYSRKRELGILSLECVRANGPTISHTDTGLLMPDWAGRMASVLYKAQCRDRMILSTE